MIELLTSEASNTLTLLALSKPKPASNVTETLFAPPPILNSISERSVPSHTVWFSMAGSAPANSKEEGGTTVISTCCVEPAQGLVFAPSVVTTKD